MGKAKKISNNEKEEGQKKISNFFQKADKKKSGLFQEVGIPGKPAIPGVCQTNDNPIVLSDSEEFVEPKDKSKTKELKRLSRMKMQSDLKVLAKTEKVSHTSKPPEAEPTVIPETQAGFTPKPKEHGSSNKGSGSNFKSPFAIQDEEAFDSDFVPDTPENLKSDQAKSKKPYSSRSYLLSSSEFSSNPIQRAKENREAKAALKRKQASAARKSLVSVSVNFNEQKTKEKSIAEKENMQHESGDNVKIEDVTPTKICENGFSLKRMAKPGVSPDAKRNTVSDVSEDCVTNATNETGDGVASNFTVMKNLNFGDGKDANVEPNTEEVRRMEIEEMNRKAAIANEKLGQKKREKIERLEKEKLERLEQQKQKAKEERKKNGLKLLNYQLHGDTGVSKKDEKSIKDDNVLDNILDELNSPKANDKVVTDSIKRSINVEKDSKVSMVEVRKELNQQTRKRYSLEKVLKFGQDAAVKSSVNKTSSQQFSGKKASDLFEKLSSEWTDKDEALMMELDMKSEMKAIHGREADSVKTVCSKEFDELTDMQELCDIKALASERNGMKTKQLKKDHIFENDSEGKGNLKFGNKHLSNKSNTEYLKKSITDQSSDRANSGRVDESNETVSVKKCTNKVTRSDALEKNIQVTKCANEVTPSDDNTEPMIVDATQAGTSREDQDEFGDDIDEFMTQLEDSEMICDQIEHFTPFKEKSSKEQEIPRKGTAPIVEFGRHTVTKVEMQSNQIVLEVLSQPGEKSRTCYLKGNWQDTHVTVGDTVHILSEFTGDQCYITDHSGFIVVNPDLLLSGTTVVGSVFCMRRSILKEKFKGCEKGNLQMLYGSILHSVFQEVLRKQLSGDSILEEASKIVKQTDTLLSIYANEATEEKVMEEIKSYLPQIKSWTEKFTSIGKPGGNQRPTNMEVLVTKVNDIEENIWSPRLGIKGKIDLTVDVVQKGDKRQSTLPLELKTGRPSYSVEHKGQVTLYSMMMSDRRKDPGHGLLLYLKEPSMKVIPADQPSKAGLVQLRNEMAYYISRQVVKTTNDTELTYNLGTLPHPISNTRACEKCPQLLNCAVYQRDVEGRSINNDGVGRLVQESLNHLSSKHIEYYTHWCLMLDLETQTDKAKKTLSDIWCLASSDRENIGACFSDMIVQSTEDTEGDCSVSFVRHQSNKRTIPLSSVGPVVTDSVVIGCDSLKWIAVCTGFIKHVSPTEIQIFIDREGVERLAKLKGETFRIDLCDSFSTAGIFYTNISRLMNYEDRYENLRSLIIERKKPEFQNTLSKTNIEKVKGIFKALNKPQKTAILKVLMSKHYVLIRGYPGTGKTSTIVAIVKVLSLLGLSVLLTSYTHSAVDNILLKLKKDNVKFLRLGRISKVHRDIRSSCADVITKGIKSVQELQTFFNSQMIVATSCLGTNHPIFSHRTFDVCIIDEASQVLQPACLGPLFSSKRFVLVGDSKQLPPVVQSKEARKLGMDESLFVRLDGSGATFDLNLQYRMNSEIMSICNRLIYNNCLKCGTDPIANRTLDIPDQDQVNQIIVNRPWLSLVLDTELNKSVVFLNTEHVPAPEFSEKGGIIRNEMEAKIVKATVDALLKVDIEGTDIGIIAPYRSQVFLIRNHLGQGQGQMSQVEVNTVDQYQGRDKSVIIISFVRSTGDTNSQKTGMLLNDVRRLNVAVTRAKSKLVMIGNIAVLEQYPPVKEVIGMAREKQQIYLKEQLADDLEVSFPFWMCLRMYQKILEGWEDHLGCDAIQGSQKNI